MDTGQLLRCIQQDEFLHHYATGVHAADQLPSLKTRPSCFIANVDPINNSGSHWIAIFCDVNGNVECFDSYGRAPNRSLKKYLEIYSKSITHNDVRIQGPLSSSCGHYCVYYLCHRVRDRSMNEIVSDFCTNFSLNDITAAEYVNINFNVNAPAYDLDFIISQICKSEK